MNEQEMKMDLQPEEASVSPAPEPAVASEEAQPATEQVSAPAQEAAVFAEEAPKAEEAAPATEAAPTEEIPKTEEAAPVTEAEPKAAYYAVQSALRPVMASARIPKFDWKAGECFRAELWLLNDAPENAQESVQVSLRLGDQVYPLLTWQTGCVAAGENRIGPTVNFPLPDADAVDMTLLLQTGTGASSEYKLCYRAAEARIQTRQLNV